ncbi:MAG: Ig-like domain-containing protein [Saprospiraceae bacterium]|nr:Ig-like domain-containing protein [Saprospiraceae bacterium]
MRQCAIIFEIVLICFCLSCASVANLPGGPKDETPPAIDEEKTTKNYQTNFTDREIIVTVDEWIKLDDPINRVLISPPLEKRADIKLKGKSVIVTFDEEEVLREDATYTINFGEAILDITEGNAMKNYAFVFSTGDKIDSLSIRGTLLDAFTDEPIEEATVMVYETTEDSIVFKEKPFYATRSAEDGSFTINNMKGGAFKIVAVKDENLNYLYDPTSETIAFLSNQLTVGSDSLPPITMRLSLEEPDPFIEDRDTSEWNKAIFTYNRIPHGVAVTYDNPDGSLFIDRKDKTVEIWADPTSRSAWNIYFTDTLQSVSDTFRLRRNGPKADVEKMKRLTRIAPSGHPNDPFYFCFDRPIHSFDTTYMRTYASDSSLAQLPRMRILDSLPMCLLLDENWRPDSTYRLTLLPGSLIDIFNLKNDTLALTMPIGNNERFGNIILNIDGLDSTYSYIIELLIKEKVQLGFSIGRVSQFKRTFSKLKPGTYQLRITEDTNNNGRWDPANYLKDVQPEKIISTDIEQLRANWDVDVNYKWNES